jgi:homoserine kinase type II
MARMHLAVHDFPQTLPNAFAPHQLESLYHKTAPHLDILQKGLRESLAEEIEKMRCWPSLGLPRGVIHADLFRDNVFFDQDRPKSFEDLGLPAQGAARSVGFGVQSPQRTKCKKYRLSGIIDFYFAATEYFAYDLAIVLNAWDCDAAGKAALLEGYEALRPLSAAEHEALPFLARGAALRFLLTRTYDWFFQVEGAVVTPKDPLEYLRKWQSWKAANNRP